MGHMCRQLSDLASPAPSVVVLSKVVIAGSALYLLCTLLFAQIAIAEGCRTKGWPATVRRPQLQQALLLPCEPACMQVRVCSTSLPIPLWLHMDIRCA